MKAFTKIPPYYDTLMTEINYKRWVAYILDIFDRFNISPKKILDLACGTGTCCLLFAKSGFDVMGVDSSKGMLDVAKSKTKRFNIKFSCQDMANFSLSQKVDVVTCLFDSPNYLLEEEELSNAYKCAYDVLNDGGFFIFDMNTEYGLSTCWGNKVYVKENKNVLSIWRNSFDTKSHIARLDLTLFIKKNGYYERLDETHFEKAYQNSKIEDLLYSTHFKEIHVYRHLSFEKPSYYTPRIMAAAKKQEA